MFSFCNTISFFSGYTDSLYCNEAMEYDEDIQEHINEINSFKPQVNKFITCLLAHALIRMVIYSNFVYRKGVMIHAEIVRTKQDVKVALDFAHKTVRGSDLLAVGI